MENSSCRNDNDREKQYKKALQLTEAHGQTHLLAFYETLTEEQKDSLLNQILSIDFSLMERLYAHAKAEEAGMAEETGEITPIGCTDKRGIAPDVLAEYRQMGEETIRSGRFAAVTMAGGQGTRLGHSGPKGTYDIGLPTHMTLFEIQCMRLKKKREELGVSIPWYIMTSRENDGATRAFFEAHDYFGYGRENIMFFVQCMLPMVHKDGKIVLEEKWKIKEGADGHGGIFTAMIKSGVTADMEARGIDWIFVGGIDNVLVRLCDPVFIGFMEASGRLIGGKSLIKRDPYEKAGVFCKKDGRPYVIEYTEISDEMANLKDDSGNFVYGDAHILCNMFNRKVFDVMGDKGLPYHTAVKKTSYIDEAGNRVTPEAPCAYKFEAFIFDAFHFFDEMAILRVVREEEFAPVKNKSGEDSPETARELFLACGEEIF